MTPDEERNQREAEQLKQSNAEADAAQHRRALAAAIAYDETKPSIEKRRRAQALANTPEAWATRNEIDPFTSDRRSYQVEQVPLFAVHHGKLLICHVGEGNRF